MNAYKYYAIYQTTCKVNGKIYIGQHRTNDLNDSYLGSGTLITEDIKRYGRDAFEKKILFTFDNFEEMNNKEKELVTPEFVAREDTYNRIVGGQLDDYEARRLGGLIAQEWRKRHGVKSRPWTQGKTKEEIAMSNAKRRATYLSHLEQGLVKPPIGRPHTFESKQKISDHHKRTHCQAGERNSQYGTHWWKDPDDKTKSERIKEGDQVPTGWVKGRWDNTVRPVKQHTCHWCGATGPIDEIPCKHPEICEKHKLFPKMIQYLGMDASCIGSERLYDEYMRIKLDLHKKYFDDKISPSEIARQVHYPAGGNNFIKFLRTFFEGEQMRKRKRQKSLPA